MGDLFDGEELQRQRKVLEHIAAQLGPTDGGSDPKQRHLAESRQIKRIDERLKALRKGASLRDASLQLPCRACQTDGCDGRCWGFWKSPIKMGQPEEHALNRKGEVRTIDGAQP